MHRTIKIPSKLFTCVAKTGQECKTVRNADIGLTKGGIAFRIDIAIDEVATDISASSNE